MDQESFSRGVRESAMRWLDARPADLVRFDWLATFEYEGHRLPLMDRQRGIRKPASMNAALSMRTVYTAPGAEPPYADAAGDDGLLRYKYRGDDAHHPENRALRRAFLDGLPLIWFVGVAPAIYEPIYPVWIVGDEPEHLQFALALDEGQRRLSTGSIDLDERRYIEQINQRRLHQPMFRARVLTAYETRCAVCHLRHAELLDAAHIVGDRHDRGAPVVPNGLALCKIHHAAFDRHILGVRPDLKVEIRREILDEVDGPMLRHGLQEMNEQTLLVPRSSEARPDRERVEERYEQFRSFSL